MRVRLLTTILCCRYTSLPSLECQLVYGIIDEAGADGIWNRTIKNRLNMHENTVKNCIKILESKGHITALKNVEHPNKKMYIKSTLRPSERATGGPWFTDGELDLAFIKHLEMAVFAYIRKHSAYDLKEASKRGGGGADSARAAAKVPKKGVIKGVAPGTTTMDSETSLSRGTKRAATEISNDPDNDTNTTAAKGTTTKPKCREDLLPHPAGYKWYPTVTEVAKVIHDTNISSTPLSEADVQQLIDVLCFDGFIEPVKVNGRLGYRVVRPTKQDNATFEKRRDDYRNGIGLDLPVSGVKPIGNGLTEAPCGRCPVFNLCEEGGPVSPNNCVYFLQWLGLDDGAAKPKAEVAAAK